MTRTVILLVLAICGLCFACGEADDSSRVPGGAALPTERHLGIGDSETHGNVSVTLVEASFSSSHSQLVLEIENHSPSPGEFSASDWMMPDVSYSGFASEVYPKYSILRTGPHATRNTVTLGPVEAPDKPVVFHIDMIPVVREQGVEEVKGPWHFEFVPGLAAVDPIDFDVTVDESACGDGICITVDRVHFSTPNVEVHYQLESDEDGFRGAPGYPVRMVFPDGTWAPGVGTSDPNQHTGPQIAAFDPLPGGVRSFKLAFGPYLEDVPGPFEIAVPVGGKLAAEEVPLDYATTLAGEDFVVRSLSLTEEGFELTLDNVNPGVRSIVHNAFGPIEVSDDQGNTYHPATMGWALGEAPLGSAVPQSFAVNFRGQLEPETQVLRLSLGMLGKLLYGPWDFDIKVPEGQRTKP